jgi:aminoglycoside phosphotransferase (APT) family kinase protein
MTDPSRHETEVLALQALADADLPVPTIIAVRPASIVMTRMPGERLDTVERDVRLQGLRQSMALLHRLHELPAPQGLPSAPDDYLIVERYRAADGPPLPLNVPPSGGSAFCHGDWTDGNLLASGGAITAIVDWEAAHVGDPLRELARAAWAASRKDSRSFEAMVEAYGADHAEVRAWTAIHAAELWLWFGEAGPPEYHKQLTAELANWPVS